MGLFESVYTVTTEFGTKGSSVPHGEKEKIGSLKDALGSLQNVASSTGATVLGAFTGVVETVGSLGMALGTAGVGAGIAAITYGVAGLNNELEKTRISLATTFFTNGATNSVTNGLGLASSMIATMRKDAADLPGEFSDLVGIFRAVAVPGMRAGGSPASLEKLSANIMDAGASSGMDMQMVAREAGMLVAGRAGAHNVLGANLFGLVGDKAAAFNKLDPAKRLAELTEKFGPFQASIDLFSRSWDGITSTLRDNAKTVIGNLTQPLFDSVKSVLARANTWFDDNASKVKGWTDVLGDGLARAFHQGEDLIAEWYPPIAKFVTDAYDRMSGIWTKIQPIVHDIAEKLKTALGDGSMLDRIEQILKLYAAVKGLGAAAGPLAGMGGVAWNGFQMLTAAEGGAGAAGLGGAAGVAGLSIEGAPAIGAAIAVGFVEALVGYGIYDTLKNKDAFGHSMAVANAEGSMSDIGQAWGLLRRDGEAITPAIRGVADTLGGLFLTELHSVTEEVATAANVLSGLRGAIANAFGSGEQSLADYIAESASGKKKLAHDSDPNDYGIQGRELAYIPQGIITMAGVADKLSDVQMKMKAGAGPGGGGTHVAKVEINVVSGNNDPSRVARFVMAEIESIAKHPKVAHGVTNWSSPSPGRK